MNKRLFRYALLILAMGVGVRAWRQHRSATQVKTMDEYWRETGVGASSLENLIDDATCSSSEKYFLACANSMLSVAARFNLNISFAGRLVPVQKTSAIAMSEKELLAPWKKFYAADEAAARKISFLSIWMQLKKNSIPSDRISFMTGVGLNGFISVFRDPHTYLMPIALYKEVISKADNKSTSLGIILGREEGHYFIRKVFPGAPADKAGLQKGDRLLSIEGTDLTLLLPPRVSELLRGDVGQKIDLRIQRGETPLDVSLVRTPNTQPTVSFRLLEGIKPVGVITVNKFAHQTCSRVKEAVELLNKRNIRGLLLDLRDNPGGQMEEAACVASLFVGPRQKIFEIRYLNPERQGEVVYGPEDKIFAGPMAVLINGGSASASEIVAGALRDLNRAVLVGETSFGKGSFQEGEVWEQNSKIALFETKGFYYLPSGRSPQIVGLRPDIQMKFKDSLQIHEGNQFINPLHAPERSMADAKKPLPFSFKNCLDAEDGSSADEDPEMGRARQALFCVHATVAGVNR